MGRDDGLQEKRRAGVLGLRRTPGGAEVQKGRTPGSVVIQRSSLSPCAPVIRRRTSLPQGSERIHSGCPPCGHE